MKQGADDYLAKPFQLEAMVASVHRAMEKKRMELELEKYSHYLNETAGQSRRVTRYSLQMVKRTGCSGKGLTEIARGAYLHDKGKIGIPDAISLKPGTLTPGERSQ